MTDFIFVVLTYEFEILFQALLPITNESQEQMITQDFAIFIDLKIDDWKLVEYQVRRKITNFVSAIVILRKNFLYIIDYSS